MSFDMFHPFHPLTLDYYLSGMNVVLSTKWQVDSRVKMFKSIGVHFIIF